MRHLTGAADRQSAHRIRNQKLRSRTGDACIRVVQQPTSAFNEATPRPIAQLDTLGPHRAGLPPTCCIGLMASRFSQAKPVVTSGPHESRAGVSDGVDQHSSWWNCARGNNVASCAHCTRKWSAIRRWYRIFPVSESDFTCARPIHEHEGRTGRGRQAHCAKASIAWLVLVRGATAGGAVQGCRVRRTRAKLSMKIILPRPAPKRVCADRPRQWYVSVSI